MLGWKAQPWLLAGMDEMAFYEALVEKMNTAVLLQMGQQVPSQVPWQRRAAVGSVAPEAAPVPAQAAPAPGQNGDGKGDGKGEGAGGKSGGAGDCPGSGSGGHGDTGAADENQAHGDGGVAQWWEHGQSQHSWENWNAASQDWQDFSELEKLEKCIALFMFVFLI